MNVFLWMVPLFLFLLIWIIFKVIPKSENDTKKHIKNDILNEKFMEKILEWSEDGMDDRIERAIDLFEEWADTFSNDEKKIVADILTNFNYYSQNRITKILKKLDKKIIEEYGVSIENSVVSVIRKNRGSLRTSSDYLDELCYYN